MLKKKEYSTSNLDITETKQVYLKSIKSGIE
jgi:hypothetical protein